MFNESKNKLPVIVTALLLCVIGTYVFMKSNATGLADSFNKNPPNLTNAGSPVSKNAPDLAKTIDAYFADNQNSVIHVDYIGYADFQTLIENVEVIIIGKILCSYGPVNINNSSSEEYRRNPDVLLSDVAVTDVAKGDLEIGEIIVLSQLMDRSTLHLFDNDDEIIMFLTDSQTFTGFAPFSFFNPGQGHINYKAPDERSLLNNFFIDKYKNGDEIWNLILESL